MTYSLMPNPILKHRDLNIQFVIVPKFCFYGGDKWIPRNGSESFCSEDHSNGNLIGLPFLKTESMIGFLVLSAHIFYVS